MNTARYVTTPIYYVNDRPHIGHAYTTVAADVLARWWRLLGNDVFFLTGTDEHGAKVAESAAAAGQDVNAFCDANAKAFQDTFAKLAITNTAFIRTTDSAHERQATIFLQKVIAAGAVHEGTYEGLYCTGCERFLTEKELVNGLCPDHKKPPERISERNHFFQLSKFLPEVKRRIMEGEIVIEPVERREEVLGLFEQGLDDFSISREKVTWGIPFPGDEKQTIYVWVEALQNYITAIGYVDDRKRFETYWPSAFHLIGKDILKFHCVYWPALLLAAGEEPPKRIFAHGFFTVNGEKMSKSLQNALDPNALVLRFGVDGTRYLLLTQFPFGSDGDVQADRFDEKFNAHLANGIGNYASRVLAMVQKYAGSEVPAVEPSRDVVSFIEERRIAFAAALEACQFDRALNIVLAIVAAGDSRIEREKPWELAKTQADLLPQTLSNVLALLSAVTPLLAPFLPESAEKLSATLGLDLSAAAIAFTPLPPGRAIAPLPPLFPRKA